MTDCAWIEGQNGNVVGKHFKYLQYVLVHKWHVFLECRRLGVTWRGFLHDMSKFLPDEWFAYANWFYGNHRRGLGREAVSNAFDLAWLRHQKRNLHHWQYWILPEDEGLLKIMDMPDSYRREMLADWIGASLALGFGRNILGWYTRNKRNIRLHPGTRAWIEEQLGVKPGAQSG